MNELERYHCQMALPGFGESSQLLLQRARVLIVGIGGLGCPAAQYLAAAGIGTLGIADDDEVELRNLHRQVLFTPEDIGLPKVKAATEKLRRQNPLVDIVPYNLRLTSFNAMELIGQYDLVIEGTDNFETKYLVNDACVILGKPLVYGAIFQQEGQMGVWNVLQEDGTYSPNYRDVFPDAEQAQVPNCIEGGVIPTLAGIIGCVQANEAIKYFTQRPDVLTGKLWLINTGNGKTRIVHLRRETAVKITGLSETIATITPEELQRKIEQDNCQLIDVRSTQEHQDFNIGGMNIPLDQLCNYLDAVSFPKPVVCYCNSGNRSVSAVRMIKQKFPQAKVYSLKKGIAQIKLSRSV